MGSDIFYTTNEAADKLKCSTRRVRQYVQEGLLPKPTMKDRIAHYPRAEVDSLSEAVGREQVSAGKRNIHYMQKTIRKLQEDMAVVKRILDISEPLVPTEEEADQLYCMAGLAEKEKEWKIEEIVYWSQIYDRLDEHFFNLLTNRETPWKVFHRLCISQLTFVSSRSGFKTDLKLQSIYLRLNLGRKKLKEAALSWFLAFGGGRNSDIINDLSSPQDPLIRRLSKGVEKTLDALG